MTEFLSFTFSDSDLLWLLFAAILIGMGKTGVMGASMLAIPIMAWVFGGKASTGIVLSMLIFADLFAVKHYHRHADWPQLRKLFPYVLAGVALGTLFGELIDDALFTKVMAYTIFISVALMVWQQRKAQQQIPTSTWFVVLIGLLSGATSMLGNLAGPVMALFLLAMQFPKNKFIGTAAWFFLAINLIKVPFHVFIWQTITLHSVLLTVLLIPAIGLGAYLGIRIIELVPEKPFRWFIILMTLLAALVLLL